MNEIIKYEQNFNDIINLIQISKTKAIFQVNSVLVDLYWNIGNYISEKCVKENWGKSIVKELSIYINQKDPNIKGFSDKNIWRMK